ncbi:MAG: Vi polysaccharide biosynthesis protein VipA/TviB [Flammeovirgaceae bacterium]|nr:Vi polysaccharide biosynthesis protein VipA/TviB [Flammeovirgaceae bacterium]
MKNICPVIVGLGYVGLPIFLHLQEHFNTVGFDINKKRIISLKKRKDYNKEFSNKDLKLKKKSIFTNKLKDIKKGNFYIVTVPTPVDKKNIPDLKILKKSCKFLSRIIKKGDIIFFESTVYPTVTDEICIPILNTSGLQENKDFYVGYSPERINPGDKKKTLKSIPKIVAFKNNIIKKPVKKVYNQISKKIIFSKNIIEAETSKAIENIQRDLNIALINEIYKVCDISNINFRNVLNLAKSKWNFIPFEPGLVGGHCLPVDPYYFSFFAKKKGAKTDIILNGRKTNNSMANFVASKISKKITNIHNYKKKKIIVMGLTYKKNVADTRNSLAIKILKILQKKFKNINACDPLIENKKYNNLKIIGGKMINKFDIYIILNKHDTFRNIIKNIQRKKIIYPF